LSSRLFSRINYEFTRSCMKKTFNSLSLFANSLSIQLPFFCKFIINSPTCMRIHFKFTMFFANSPWMFIANWKSTSAFIFNSLSFSWIHFQFTVFITKPTMIHYLFGEITNDWLTFSWIHYGFPIFFASSLRIHNLFCELTSNSLSIREFTFNSLSFFANSLKFTILFANLLQILYFFREFTFKSIPFFPNSLWISQLVRKFTSNLLFSSRIQHEFILSRIDNFLARSLSIHYVFRESRFNSISFFAIPCFRKFITNSQTCSQNRFEFILSSRIHYQFTIFFADSLWIHFESLICFANALSIHHLFREWTLNLLSSSRIHYQLTLCFQ